MPVKQAALGAGQVSLHFVRQEPVGFVPQDGSGELHALPAAAEPLAAQVGGLRFVQQDEPVAAAVSEPQVELRFVRQDEPVEAAVSEPQVAVAVHFVRQDELVEAGASEPQVELAADFVRQDGWGERRALLAAAVFVPQERSAPLSHDPVVERCPDAPRPPDFLPELPGGPLPGVPPGQSLLELLLQPVVLEPLAASRRDRSVGR